MNPWLMGDLAQERTGEIRREAARRQTGASAPPARPKQAPNGSLRAWAGFALVEAGLRLLATPSVPAPRRAADRNPHRAATEG
jgi:hypothetical protein